MTYGSLFTGIGGIDRGLDAAGFHCRWQVENDPYAVKVLEKHWPTVKRYGDICSIDGSELEPVDLVCGGFPCQDLSQAGKRVGIEGTRSGLWFEYARLVRELRPRYVLIENVPGLLVSDAMRRVVGELARLGYVGCWRSLRASEFGASHLRKRVFIIACRDLGDAAQLPRLDVCGNGRDVRQADAGARAFAPPHGDDCPPSRELGDHNGAGREARHQLAELRQPSGSNGLTDGSNEELAHSPEARRTRPEDGGTDRSHAAANGSGSLQSERSGGPLAHPGHAGNRWTAEPSGLNRQRASGHDSGASGTLANPINRLLQKQGRGSEGRDGAGSGSAYMEFAPGPSDPRWPIILRERPDLAPALAYTGRPAVRKPNGSELDGTGDDNGRGKAIPERSEGTPSPEPPLCRVADGISNLLDGAMSSRTKRLGRLGNAVVPQIAEWIGGRILEFDKELTYG